MGEGDILMIVDGQKTEFSKIKNILVNNEIQLDENFSLICDHEIGTELKRLNPISEPIKVKLAAVASANTNILHVSGPDVRKLKIGNVLKINNPSKNEFCQITEISGPAIGLDSSTDIFVQIGGIVTNTAKAPITGAEISLFDANLIFIKKTISDAEGRFRFQNLNKGKYTFKVEAQGYQPLEKPIEDISLAMFEEFIFQLQSI